MGMWHIPRRVTLEGKDEEVARYWRLRMVLELVKLAIWIAWETYRRS
jgi:hypothetical protein